MYKYVFIKSINSFWGHCNQCKCYLINVVFLPYIVLFSVECVVLTWVLKIRGWHCSKISFQIIFSNTFQLEYFPQIRVNTYCNTNRVQISITARTSEHFHERADYYQLFFYLLVWYWFSWPFTKYRWNIIIISLVRIFYLWKIYDEWKYYNFVEIYTNNEIIFVSKKKKKQ